MALPFVHWLPKGRVRFAFAAVLRSMGLGNYKQKGESIREWTERKLAWMDKYCHYEKLSFYYQLFSEYKIVHKELE